MWKQYASDRGGKICDFETTVPDIDCDGKGQIFLLGFLKFIWIEQVQGSRAERMHTGAICFYLKTINHWTGIYHCLSWFLLRPWWMKYRFRNINRKNLLDISPFSSSFFLFFWKINNWKINLLFTGSQGQRYLRKLFLPNPTENKETFKLLLYIL